HLFERAREHHGLAGDRRIALRPLGVEDGDFAGQPFDDAAIVTLAEICPDARNHGVADLVERIHLGHRLLIVACDPEAGVMNRLPRAVAAGQCPRRGLADLAHAEREDEALERDPAPSLDGGEQIAHRGFAITLVALELDAAVARRQREDVGRLLHPGLLEEELDLLLAEPVDVEGAARGEQFQVLDLLERTGELAGAARAGALLAGCGLLAHHVGMQRTRALLRKMEDLRILRPLVDDDVNHLRNDVAGALDDDGIANPDVAPLAELLAVAADPPDVVFVVQRHVLHDDAADPDRLELADRRERAGAPDLDLDVLQHGHGALGRKFVRDRPARRARYETQTLLPVEAVDLVDHPVDVVVETGALFLDLAMER